MELSGEGSWGSGKGAAPQGGGHGTGCPGLRAQTRLPEFKKHLVTAVRHRVWILLWSQGLHSVASLGPFQLGISYHYDSDHNEGKDSLHP